MQAKNDKPQAPAKQPRKRIKRGQRSKRMYLLLAGCLFLCLLAVGAGFALNQLDKTLDVVTVDPYKLPDQPVVEKPYEQKKSIAFAIVGVDTRKNIGMLNTDVLVVAVANPVTQKLSMVSLPRDTRVQIPGYPGYHKVNEVFALGENIRKDSEIKGKPVTENGMTMLKKTLNHMLGISVEHYVQLDFEGFTAVIDKLGGITVDVDRDLVYELPKQGVYRSLKKGKQVLNGEQALGFVRHRIDRRGDAYNSSDFDRNRRQQQVIRAVAEKSMSMDGLSSLTAVLDTVGQHIKTDLSKDQIKGLALDFASFSSSNMVTLDNGAIWSSPYSLWPRENMQAVRTALQTEVGAAGSGEQLSDAAVAEVAKVEMKAEKRTPAPNPKPTTGTKEQPKTQKPATPPPNTAPEPTQEPVTPDGNGGERNPEPTDSNMPPPDILAPPAPATDSADIGQTG
ncbi:LCP family protein [Brevibacillus sp. AG]|uniref:LCP family protein n=1 Tax=Brevibacillus sp. AG TaxID=3020891 RepID=UPI00232B1D1E|nr:LCP family protein [Brevibacillus sp. AG]MDC0760348.1 LCP family protein [Brevibacillus sp. AG]